MKPTTIAEAAMAHEEARSAPRKAVMAAHATEREIVPDPFRPGEMCQRWESGVHPLNRHQTAMGRSFERSEEIHTATREARS